MGEQIRTVAILISNAALSSILSMTLAGVSSLRVRPFDSMLALTTYLRLAPVDLIVTDFDNDVARADLVATAVRADTKIERRDVQILALAGALTPHIKVASIHCGIDEIIMKPMSPKYLVERVLARLARKPDRTAFAGAERRVITATRPRQNWSQFGDNVVPLFRPTQQPHA